MTGVFTHSLTPDTPVQYVKGIGPKRAELLKMTGITKVGDLLNWFPRRYLDRSCVTKIGGLKSGDQVTVVGTILSCDVARGRRNRFIALVGDGTGVVQCVWFQGVAYISKVFQPGETVAFSGKVTIYRGPQLVHPEYDKMSENGESDALNTGRIIPMYSSTETLSRSGLDSRGFRRILHGLLDGIISSLHESLPDEVLNKQGLMRFPEAVANIHFPDNWQNLRRARYRLKFEELFFLQLFLALQRKNREVHETGIVFEKTGERTKQLFNSLPFELTDAQKRVSREIRNDMRSTRCMNRLLQGDVGSGKTVVALMAMVIAVENGFQAVLMAPTEILAEQHFLTIHSLLENLEIRIALLKGGQKGAEKKEIQEKLSAGEIDIAVGTHTLVQKGVDFNKLGLVVIDEQHRFGVMQRATLMRKAASPDVLVMTATPIPRTLALTLYGDLDVSVLDELPEGRQPVKTVWRKAVKRNAIYTFLRDEIQNGRQAYIVYPLVEESEKLDLAAATEGFEILSTNVFPELNLALLHGRMKSEEKESVMNRFKSGDIQILVCTSVVEVGVDVPNATVMLIEHAERFGLTQLHQLRGRVGRGSLPSTCILLTQGGLTEDAMKRIQTMTETSDGFKISEADLQIRGPGELCGTRQHGCLNLKIADLMTDGPILNEARQEAFQIVETDPDLNAVKNKGIRDAYFNQYKNRFDLIEVG